jgi:CHASE3 domain sensor protein
LTSDNPAQGHKLDILGALVSERLATLRETIETRNSGGLSAAVVAIFRGKSQRRMEVIRADLSALKAEKTTC